MVRIRYDEGAGEPTQVAPGLFMSLPGTVRATDTELDDGDLYDVTMVLDLTPEGVRPTSVTVTAQGDSRPITSTTLRAVKVWAIAQEGILLGLWRGRANLVNGRIASVDMLDNVTALSDAEVTQLRQQGPTDESLEWVANFYNLGTMLGLPPAKQVEVNLGLPRTTATKWIKRARDKGLLDRGED